MNTDLTRAMIRSLANDKRRGRAYLEHTLLAACREIDSLRAQMQHEPDPSIPSWMHRILGCVGIKITRSCV